MVEMLGVLAIIGVLSIGGIQGYTMAMRRYKANEILNELQKHAVSYYTSAHQKMLNDEVAIGEDGEWVNKATNMHFHGDVINVPGLQFSATEGIKSTNSGDFVLFACDINNKQLCETIINITGDLADGFAGKQCVLDGAYYVFYLSFLMN